MGMPQWYPIRFLCFHVLLCERSQLTAVSAKALTTGRASPSGMASAMVRLARGSRGRTARFWPRPRIRSFGTMEMPSPCYTMARMA